MVILQQEKARDFFSELKPEKLFDCFYKATGLMSLDENYKAGSQSLKAMEEDIEKVLQSRDEIKKKIEAENELLKKIDSMQDISFKKEYEKSMKWAHERMVFLNLTQIKENKIDLENSIRLTKNICENLEEEIKKLRSECDQAEAKSFDNNAQVK